MRGIGSFVNDLIGWELASTLIVIFGTLLLYNVRDKFRDWYDLPSGEKEGIIALIISIVGCIIWRLIGY